MSGDSSAARFDAFVLGSGRRLLRTAYLLTDDHGAAEDLVHDVLVRAWSRWSNVSGGGDPETVVRRMLAGASVRRSGQRQRAVAVLSFDEDLPDAQIADALRCSTGTVARLRTKAMHTMRAVPSGEDRDLPADGAALRETARRIRVRRQQMAAGTTAGLTVAATFVAIAAWPGAPAPAQAPPPLPVGIEARGSSFETQPDSSWLQVPVTDDMYARAVAATGGDSSSAPVVSARLPGAQRVVVMLATRAQDDLRVSTVTFESDRPGASAVGGTSGIYPSYSSVIAQPVHDGAATRLLVLLPQVVGDTVVATSSVPGRALRRTSAFVTDRLALLPVTSPESITRLLVLREGMTVVDTIPAGSLLFPEVPRTLERVIASSAGPPNQPVQVRTDGRTACRLTVGGWWDGPAFVAWNPLDTACAPVDGRLHLMLADDRRYSNVAGLAPPGTTSVRLYWRSGDDSAVTEVPVTTNDGVTAFVDSSGRRPDHLVRAEATRAGDVIGTVLPPT